MSIIHDALNKAQEVSKTETTNQNVPAQQNNPSNPSSPAKLKINIQEMLNKLKPLAKNNMFVLSVGVIFLVLIGLLTFKKIFHPRKVAAPSAHVESSVEIIPKKVEPVITSSVSINAESSQLLEQKTIEEKTVTTPPPVPTLNLNGIFYGGEDSYAIINNKIVKIGDTIKEAVVTEINKDSVKLKFYDLELLLRLK